MKIALVRQRYNPYGGAERFLARAMEALRARGAETVLVTREWAGAADAGAIVCNPFYVGSLWRDWSFARSACRALGQRRFDLVQSHERIACCDVYRAGDGVHREWLNQRARVLGPLRRLATELNPFHRYVLAAERRLFASPRLRAVICNSRMVRQEIRDHFGLPETKLHVVYSGVDTLAFHPDLRARHRQAQRQRLGFKDSETVFLLVGSGFERKGVAALLEALSRLPAAARAVVVGEDKNRARYLARGDRLGLGDRVLFLGGQQDVKPFYGMADALVLPTLYDPFPNVALEAMASGLPAVTSTKCGAAELLEEGVSGHVCDALDVAGLAGAMTRLLDRSVCEAMGARARKAVEGFTPEAMAERLLALYRGLLQGA
ncbi:MAG: glycosyltransferase family 4 protein [Betaproteobacteria bacterium]|nr:glycosyltransferase family 4 protein [Betaproteobacteria bacterium]